jgi:hypothetical protein
MANNPFHFVKEIFELFENLIVLSSTFLLIVRNIAYILYKKYTFLLFLLQSRFIQ